MKISYWAQLNARQQAQLLLRPAQSQQESKEQQTRALISEVRENGDDAVQALTRKFDGVELAQIKVSDSELQQAKTQVSAEILAAIEFAISQVEKYHQAQQPGITSIETQPGVVCQRYPRPIQKVGLYVPGGATPLVSTVIMLAIPAKIAGCSLRVLTTPPNKDGLVDPHILVAAQLCGITDIYKVGGVQAIAAMAYGTQTIPKVSKIFGPGNSWVTQAKVLVAQDPEGAICDMPAGPSEVLVIADDTANVEFIVADLLSQAEHGPDSQVIFITTSETLAQDCLQKLQTECSRLSRKEIAEQSLAHSRVIIVENIDQALAISNRYAPEHLILQLNQPQQYVADIHHAGAVFLGHWAPETVGDYVTGSNHVLPTYGYAQALSGLSLKDFIRFISVQSLTPEGLKTIGPYAQKLAGIEGLQAHQRAVSVRLKELEKLL